MSWYAAPCPRCDAESGQACRSARGNTVWPVHVARKGAPSRMTTPFPLLLAELDHLDGLPPDVVAQRLGVTTAGIAKALQRHGMRERARPFQAAYERMRTGAA